VERRNSAAKVGLTHFRDHLQEHLGHVLLHFDFAEMIALSRQLLLIKSEALNAHQ
jgi:hypothetical protein